MKKSSFIFLLFWVGHYSAISAQADVAVGSILNSDVFKHAQVSVAAMALDTKEKIISYHDDIALIPASSLKLITTLSAIDILGEDFQYRTDVLLSGELDRAGTWRGDLIIKGSGDPTLASPKMNVPTVERITALLVEKLKARGVNCIDGDIIMDQSRFGQYPIGDSWAWNDLGNYYAAGSYGINFYENLYHIFFQQKERVGDQVSIHHTEPSMPSLRLRSEVLTGRKGSGDNAYIFGNPYGNRYWITGTIPPGSGLFSIKGAMPHPARSLGEALRRGLEEVGIGANDVIVTDVTVNRSATEKLFHIHSPKLNLIVKEANEVSNNLYCEALLRTIVPSDGATAAQGLHEIMQHLEGLSLDTDAIQMDDGSGLSSFNRITSDLFVRFLVAREKGSQPQSHKLLPRAGLDGTAKYLRIPEELHNRVYLKSGSIGGVFTYTGWIEAQSGRWIAFSFMSNGHTSSNAKIRTQVVKLIEHIYHKY